MKFEHISILKGDLTNDKVENEIEKFKQYFKEQNIKMEYMENLGLKRLAYNVKGYNQGNYLRFEFSGDNINLSCFEKFIRENDNVIKFITVRNENEIKEEKDIFDEIEDLDESNLYKAIAEATVIQLQNNRNIEFDLDAVEDITEDVLEDEKFCNSMSNAIKSVIKVKYSEKEEEEVL